MTGCTCTPRAEKKIWGRNLAGKVLSAPPPAGRARVKFFRTFLLGEIWRVEVVNLAVIRF